MTTAHVFIATSLDGYIARPDGNFDWLMNPAWDGDHGYESFIAGIDGIVMGRKSFESILGFDWPYTRPVWVLSRNLTRADLPESHRDKVRLLSATPRELLALAGAEGWGRAYIDGGEVIRGFLAEGLIADITLTRVPLLLGAGRPLFGPLAADVALIHEETRAFPTGLVQSRYRFG